MNNEILFGDVSSSNGTLNSNDWVGLARTAGLVVASSLVTWLAGLIPTLDLGQHATLILPVVMFLLEGVRRWIGSQNVQPLG